MQYVGDRGIRTPEEAKVALEEGELRLYAMHGYGPYRMVLRGTKESIGVCGLFRRESLDDPDLGFAVLRGYRRQGYVFEAARSVVAYARDQLKLPRLIAIVSPDNAASVAITERLGLQFENMHRLPGEDGDIAVYGMRLRA